MCPSPRRALPGLATALCLLLACSPAPGAGPAATPTPGPQPEPAGRAMLVGEWSPDKDLCGDSRMSFTADGRHEALMDDGDGWKVLAAGTYQLDGRQLTIRFEGESQQRELVSVDESRLVLAHDDEDLAAVTGGFDVVLHRCPERAGTPPA